MKKALQANISDKIFFIDEDAYLMLRNYLHQLSITFPGSEGQEIVDDIEQRIAELFTEQAERGVNVIDIRYVSKVIDTVGRPEQLDDTSESAPATPPPFVDPGEDEKPRKHLYRNVQNKVFGGVLGGIAAFLGWDATILRLLIVVLALFTAVMPCVLIYLVAWMIIRPADTPRRVLEMRGEEVNLSTVSQTVKDTSSNAPFDSGADTVNGVKGVVSDIFGVCSKILMAIVGTFGIIVGGGLLISLLVLLFVLIMFACVGVAGVSAMLSVTFSMLPVAATIWLTLILLAFFILTVALIWAAGAVVFNWRAASRVTAITAVAVFLVLVAAIVILTFFLVSNGFFNTPFIIAV